MKHFFFLLLLFLCLSSCANKQPQADKTTETFNYFLKESLGDSIPQTAKIWVLIPQNGCKGCRQSGIKKLAEILNQNHPEISVIISPAITDTILIPARFDHSGLIDQINLPVSGFTIIKTKNKKVYDIREVQPDRIDSLPYYLEVAF
jgi:hypothetical protein